MRMRENRQNFKFRKNISYIQSGIRSKTPKTPKKSEAVDTGKQSVKKKIVRKAKKKALSTIKTVMKKEKSIDAVDEEEDYRPARVTEKLKKEVKPAKKKKETKSAKKKREPTPEPEPEVESMQAEDVGEEVDSDGEQIYKPNIATEAMLSKSATPLEVSVDADMEKVSSIDMELESIYEAPATVQVQAPEYAMGLILDDSSDAEDDVKVDSDIESLEGSDDEVLEDIWES